MQRHSKAVPSPTANPEAKWNLDPQSIDAVAKAYAAWFSQAKRMQDETMRFAQERLKKELAVAVQLTRCTNPNEALAVQAKFANTMAEDYLAEGQRIVEMMGRMAKEISPNPKSNRTHH